MRRGWRGVQLWGLIIALSAGLLAACSLTASPDDRPATPIPSPVTAPAGAAPLTLAWVDNGDLYTWTHVNPTPRRIASGGVIRAILAPDGARVAYLRGPDGDPRSLWISDTPGAAERQLVDAAALPGENAARRIDQVVWSADGQALYFNTFTGSGMDTRPADDLWRVAVDAPVVRLLDDGQGGQMALSPDRTLLALASAGRYAQPGESSSTPAEIALYSLLSGERSLVLDYPAVATASQTRWYPDLRWMPDSSGVRTAIPSADLVYGTGDTALWALPVQGEIVPLGTVAADFFGLPVFSADGTWIAYIERRATVEQTDLTLRLARDDGSASQVYAQGDVGTLTRPAWLSDGLMFTYSQGGAGVWWLGGPGIDPWRFPRSEEAITQLLWVDANTAVFSAIQAGTGPAGAFGLYVAPREGGEPAQLIATASAYPFFDAVRP